MAEHVSGVPRGSVLADELQRHVARMNHQWQNRVWKAFGFRADYDCELAPTPVFDSDGYRGIAYFVLYGAKVIAVLTLWQGYEDRFVIGTYPKRHDPHRKFFAKLYANLRRQGIRLELGRPR